MNKITGLKEGFDRTFSAPLVFQRGITSLRFNGQQTAVHKVPLANGKTLDFYARLTAHDELFVVLHGAISPGRKYYPRFERFQSLKSVDQAIMHFADPTLQYSEDEKMRLAWYLGGPGWDPLYDIAISVKRAMGKSGARRVVFIGGSGGGFASLRLSASFPGSLAFVQDPQTSIENYSTRIVRIYFETVWHGWNRNKVIKGFPERFDIGHLYRRMQPENYVYYAQNSTDLEHIELHYEPFVHSVSGRRAQQSVKLPRFNFEVYSGEESGHGVITESEFSYHLNSALHWWRNQLRK